MCLHKQCKWEFRNPHSCYYISCSLDPFHLHQTSFKEPDWVARLYFGWGLNAIDSPHFHFIENSVLKAFVGLRVWYFGMVGCSKPVQVCIAYLLVTCSAHGCKRSSWMSKCEVLVWTVKSNLVYQTIPSTALACIQRCGGMVWSWN